MSTNQSKHQKRRRKCISLTKECNSRTAPTPENLAAAALGTFKVPKKRNIGKSSRSCLADLCHQAQHSIPWKELLKKRRGYNFLVRIITKLQSLLRKRGRKYLFEGDQAAPLQNKALFLLFRGERENSFRAAQNRRGCPAYTITEDKDLILVQRKHHPSSGKTDI